MTRSPGPPVYMHPNAVPAPEKSRFWMGFGAGCATAVAVVVVVLAILMFAGLIVGLGAARNIRTRMNSHTNTTLRQAAPASEEMEGEAEGTMNVEELAIQTALDEDDLERATELAGAYRERAPDSPMAKSLLATVAIEERVAAEDTLEADRLLQEALEAGVMVRGDTQLGVAELWLDDGEAERCRAIADRVYSKVKGDNPDAQYLRGVSLLIRGLARGELGDPTGGAADMKLAISMAPSPEIAKDWQDYLDVMQEQAQ